MIVAVFLVQAMLLSPLCVVGVEPLVPGWSELVALVVSSGPPWCNPVEDTRLLNKL
jgi:hypothetical protein